MQHFQMQGVMSDAHTAASGLFSAACAVREGGLEAELPSCVACEGFSRDAVHGFPPAGTPRQRESLKSSSFEYHIFSAELLVCGGR